MVLLDTGTAGTSREIYSEDANCGTRTRNPSVYRTLEHSVCNRGVASSRPTINLNSFLFFKNFQRSSVIYLKEEHFMDNKSERG